MNKSSCQLCGEPMPDGEEMFNYHGYSGPCPKPAEETRKKNADECAYCLDGDKPVWRNGTWVHLPTDSGVGIRECRDTWAYPRQKTNIYTAASHLRVALSQALPTDDQIIIQHMRDALACLEGK